MNRNRNKQNYAVFLLINELVRGDRLPPVTLSIIILNVVTYLELFDIEYPSLNAVCLSATAIVAKKQWLRLILSPFFHADDWHLYYNMSSFALKGRSLENRYGAKKFLFIIILFSILCSLTLVGLEYVGFFTLGNINALDECAVGFSGVIFALKVLTTHHLPDGTVYFMEKFPIPSKYAYWAELVVISLLTPNVSFAGIFKKFLFEKNKFLSKLFKGT